MGRNVGKGQLPKGFTPFNQRTPEERKEISRKGGQASAAKRAQAKKLRDLMDEFMASGCTDEAAAALLRAAGIEPTHKANVAMQAVLKAETGDIEAAKFVRDTIGEKPTDNMIVGTIDAETLATMDLSRYTDAELTEMIRRAEEANGE